MRAFICAVLLLLAVSNAYAAIDQQIAECEQSDFPDLCLASLSSAGADNTNSGKSEGELIAGCGASSYRSLCVSAVARSLNKREICSNIADSLEMEACFADFDSSLPSAAAPKPSQAKPFDFVSFSVMMAIMIILYILYRRKKKNTPRN